VVYSSRVGVRTTKFFIPTTGIDDPKEQRCYDPKEKPVPIRINY
jgi:hypothetical protein